MIPKNSQGPTLATGGGLEDPPDELGAEMNAEARVWRTYVRETDRWDKELVDGRNNSLDVLLIFAALFSAISTAFIIVGLGDLKPNPAESSARTLLAISHTLVAISNGQPTWPPEPSGSEMEAFSPPHSAVVVNVLWLLSLSLSVAVSLIAMLAKEWCYKFMSGRSGVIHVQARRRQRRWNGIERWKMQEVVTYLPGLLHLALFLFAVGLTIYLWNINITVGISVLFVTVLASCVYGFATILPFVDRFCPYSTPISLVLDSLGRTAQTPIRRLALFLIEKRFVKKPGVSRALGRFIRSLSIKKDDPDGGTHLLGNVLVPMDVVTSQMLAWLLTNCEDKRSIDVVIQAIGAARPELPFTPLAQCNVLELIGDRLESCFKLDDHQMEYQLKDDAELPAAIRYSLAFSALASGNECFALWEPYAAQFQIRPFGLDPITRSMYELDLRIDDVQTMQRMRVWSVSLLDYVRDMNLDSNTLAILVAGTMAISPWETRALAKTTCAAAVQLATNALHRHIQTGYLSTQALVGLIESSAHYLIGYWPKMESPEQSTLPSLLICVFLKSYQTVPNVASIISVVLAAAAFVTHQYPGGEEPGESLEIRQKRAIQLLRFYQAKKPDSLQMRTLFIFGLFGLLPCLDLRQLEEWDAYLAMLQEVVSSAPAMRRLAYNFEIHTVPWGVQVDAHVTNSARRCLTSMFKNTGTPVNEDAIVLSMSAITQTDLRRFMKLEQIYLLALAVLCQAESTKLRALCMELLKSQKITASLVTGLSDQGSLFRNVIDGLPSIVATNVRDSVGFYLGLLIASLMLSTNYSLDLRQRVLNRLVKNHDIFTTLVPSNQDRRVPNKRRILSLVGRRSDDGQESNDVQSILQLVVDFCHADPSMDPPDEEEASNEGWMAELQTIQDNFVPNALGAEGSDPVQIEQLSDVPPDDDQPDGDAVVREGPCSQERVHVGVCE